MGRVTTKLPMSIVRDAAMDGFLPSTGRCSNWGIEADERTGGWRWGNEYQIVLAQPTLGEAVNFWAFDYRLSEGDGDWTTFSDYDDAELVELYQVERREVITHEYRPVTS